MKFLQKHEKTNNTISLKRKKLKSQLLELPNTNAKSMV
jgi:hypothetical protein